MELAFSVPNAEVPMAVKKPTGDNAARVRSGSVLNSRTSLGWAKHSKKSGTDVKSPKNLRPSAGKPPKERGALLCIALCRRLHVYHPSFLPTNFNVRGVGGITRAKANDHILERMGCLAD